MNLAKLHKNVIFVQKWYTEKTEEKKKLKKTDMPVITTGAVAEKVTHIPYR